MINVVVVDDSPFMIQTITAILHSEPGIRVIGSARSGEESIARSRELNPDCMTMDINMPGMGGIQAVREIMSAAPVPIVMLSAHSEEGADVTLKALEYGAVDFVQKPDGEISTDLDQVKEELLRKIRAAATSNIRKIRAAPVSMTPVAPAAPHPAPPISAAPKPRAAVVLAIGVSTGGPRLLKEIIALFPPDLHAAILISQHLPAGYTAKLAASIAESSRLEVGEARDLMDVSEGTVHLCPGGRDLTVKNGKIFIKQPYPDALFTPSVDVMFGSLADEYGKNCAGIVLTGMGEDGRIGAKRIKDKGGYLLAQDKDSCVIFGMPRVVIEAGLADEVVPARMIPHRALRWVNDRLRKIGT